MQALCRGRVNNELCADRRGIPAGARQSAGVSVYWVVRQGGQQSGGVAGVAAQGGGDVAVAVGAQDAEARLRRLAMALGTLPVPVWRRPRQRWCRGCGAAPRCPSGRVRSRPGREGGPDHHQLDKPALRRGRVRRPRVFLLELEH
jgi:hypothetical protein